MVIHIKGVEQRDLTDVTIDAAKDWNDKPVTNLKELTIGNTTDEDGFLKIFGKNINTIILGDATHEGGDIKVYRDGSNNLQLSLDADAASNAIAMSVYGGVVMQNYLTVGQTTLDLAYKFYVAGGMKTNGEYRGAGLTHHDANGTNVSLNIYITSGSGTHSSKLQIDSQDIVVAQATGDGAGGITNKAIGVFGVTPQVRQAHIADPTDLATCITALSTLLADMEGYGWLLDS